MPLLEAVQEATMPWVIPEATPAEQARPSALDVAAAAFRQGNIVSSLYDRMTTPRQPFRPSEAYDPFADLDGYEDYAARFMEVDSPEESAFIKARIDAERRDRQTLQQAGAWGLASTIAAGAVDPATLAAMAIPVVGASRAGLVGRAVATQLAGDTAIEAAFHATQETRTVQESALNVGAGAVLTGVLGSAIAARVPKAEFERVRKAMNGDLVPDGSVGAAAVRRPTTLAEESIAKGGETIAGTLGRISPGERVLRSPSKEARRILQELSETPEQLAKNAQGIATPQAVETSLKRYMGDWWQAYRAKGEAYSAYRTRAKKDGEKVLSRKQFGEEIAYAMRRGDKSPIPEVEKAAAAYRRFVFEPLKAKAQKLGLLAEDVETIGAESYLMRQYNVAKIKADEKAWTETLVEGFQAQGIERAEALDIAYQVTRNITGSERGTLDLKVFDDVVPASGRLKQRELRLPDELLEPWLVSDIDNLSHAYVRTLAPEVEITARFGDRDMKDAFSKIKDEYGVMKAAAEDNATLKALSEREAADLQDLAAIRDRLYGHFGAPKNPGSFFVRAGRFIRALNYTRLLGGQVLSSMTDTARMMLTYGAPKMAGSALKLATNIQALKIGRNEARRMGTGLDLVLNTRGILLGDVSEFSTFPEQAFMRKVSDAFSVISLQSPWNSTMKSWASVMSSDDILRAADKVARGMEPSKLMRARLAQIGIDDDMLRRIAAEAEEHGLQEGGLRFGMSDDWKDKEAAKAFELAVIKEVDQSIITPGASDLPLVHSTEWGKAWLQFQSFAISSTRRLQVPLAQGMAAGDLKAMQATAALFGLGSMVYALKQITADQPIEDDPQRFALEMVDRSGVLGWGGSVIFPSLWQFGSDDYSRWSDRQPVETLGGPVAGTIADTFVTRWPARIADGDVSQADIHKLRRLLPGQNLFYMRRAINALEQEVAE